MRIFIYIQQLRLVQKIVVDKFSFIHIIPIREEIMNKQIEKIHIYEVKIADRLEAESGSRRTRLSFTSI